jgi:hypothetical protein
MSLRPVLLGVCKMLLCAASQSEPGASGGQSPAAVGTLRNIRHTAASDS